MEEYPFWEGGGLVWCPSIHPSIHITESSIPPSVRCSIYPFLQIILVLNLLCGLKFNQVRPPNSGDDLCFLFCLLFLLWYVYTVRKFNWLRYCITLYDEIFDNFPLFDEILRHIELCNMRQQSNTAKSAKLFLTVYFMNIFQMASWPRTSLVPPLPPSPTWSHVVPPSSHKGHAAATVHGTLCTSHSQKVVDKTVNPNKRGIPAATK